MAIFGLGEVEIVVIAAIAILFFGRNAVKGWYKDLKEVALDWRKDKAQIDMELASKKRAEESKIAGA